MLNAAGPGGLSSATPGFAEKLDSLGEYDRAAVEYLRFAYENPGGEKARWAFFRAGRSLERANKFEQAAAVYNEVTSSGVADSLAGAACYRIALTYFSRGRLNDVIAYADDARFDTTCAGPLSYLAAWAYFFGRDYPAAESTFFLLEPESFDSSAGFMVTVSEKGQYLPRRSPFLAASMSALLPGAGKAYCGRWGDALVNLVAVAGMLGGAYALWEDDRSFAVGLAISGGIFYGGNIYGSYVGARWFNEEKHRELYRYARERVPKRPEELYDY